MLNAGNKLTYTNIPKGWTMRDETIAVLHVQQQQDASSSRHCWNTQAASGSWHTSSQKAGSHPHFLLSQQSCGRLSVEDSGYADLFQQITRPNTFDKIYLLQMHSPDGSTSQQQSTREGHGNGNKNQSRPVPLVPFPSRSSRIQWKPKPFPSHPAN